MNEATEPPTTRRVAVVGGGIVGLCLAEALARRGFSLWCFERGIAGGGQSGGVTRIFRHRHENPQLVELALKARSSWTALEERLGERLLGDEGVLILSEDDEAERLEQLGVSVEALSWEAAARLMPLGEPSGKEPRATLENDGGAIRARFAIDALHRAVSQSVIAAEVQGIRQDESGVTIFASDGIYRADEVFVTAGAGTARLAKAGGVEIPEQPAYHLRLTFGAEGRLPCLLDRSDQYGEVAYGSPTPAGMGYAIGISSDDGAVAVGDSEAPDPQRLAQIRLRVEEYAARLMPAGLGAVTGARLCLTTPLSSGDDDFYAWRRDRVTYFAGHNLFKFAPLIGSLLAESVDSRELPQELQLTPPTGSA